MLARVFLTSTPSDLASRPDAELLEQLSALSRRSLGALSALSLGVLPDLSRPSLDSSLQMPLLFVCTLGSPGSATLDQHQSVNAMAATNESENVLECKICLMRAQKYTG